MVEWRAELASDEAFVVAVVADDDVGVLDDVELAEEVDNEDGAEEVGVDSKPDVVLAADALGSDGGRLSTTGADSGVGGTCVGFGAGVSTTLLGRTSTDVASKGVSMPN